MHTPSGTDTHKHTHTHTHTGAAAAVCRKRLPSREFDCEYVVAHSRYVNYRLWQQATVIVYLVLLLTVKQGSYVRWLLGLLIG